MITSSNSERPSCCHIYIYIRIYTHLFNQIFSGDYYPISLIHWQPLLYCMPFSSCLGSCPAAHSTRTPSLPRSGLWLAILGHSLPFHLPNHPPPLLLATCGYHPRSLQLWHLWYHMDVFLTVVEFREFALCYHSTSTSPCQCGHLPYFASQMALGQNCSGTEREEGKRRKEREMKGMEGESSHLYF